MQRVNGSLGSLMSDSCIWNNLAPEETGGSDWDLRWSNATLVKVMMSNNNSGIFVVFVFVVQYQIQHNMHCVDFIYRKLIDGINRFPCWSLRRHNFSSWCLTAHLIDHIRTFTTLIAKWFQPNQTANYS